MKQIQHEVGQQLSKTTSLIVNCLKEYLIFSRKIGINWSDEIGNNDFSTIIEKKTLQEKKNLTSEIISLLCESQPRGIFRQKP